MRDTSGAEDMELEGSELEALSASSVGLPDGHPGDSNEVADQESVNEPQGPIYVCRVALPLLRLSDDTPPMFTMPEARKLAAEVEAKVRNALAEDPRVAEVYPSRALEVDNARTHTFFDFDMGADNLIEALSTFQVLRFNDVLQFRVRVPAKNQPKYRSRDDVPSDEYLVVWDGVSAAVQWEQQTTMATGSGGHVVLDLLCDIGAVAGYPVEILACSAGCHHRFVHADFVTFDDDDLPSNFAKAGETPVGSTVVVPFRRHDDAFDNLMHTYVVLHPVLNSFAETKALADAVSFLEDRGRRDATEILDIAYRRAARSHLPDVRNWWRDKRKLRGSRRRTRQLIAGLWLTLATTDEHVRTWQWSNARFNELLEGRRLTELKSDFDTGEHEIQSMDLSLVRASLEEISSRMEGRMMLMAGFAGAGAALAGSTVTALLT